MHLISLTQLLIIQDKDKLMELLTYLKVEENVTRRVKTKAEIFGQEVNPDASSAADPALKIQPELAAQLYDKWVMPLTKEVQVQYLLRRLDWPPSFAYLSQDTHQFSSALLYGQQLTHK